MLDKSSQFLSSEQSSELKNLDVALNNAGVEKYFRGNLRLRSTWRPFDSHFERKGTLSDGGISVVSSVIGDITSRVARRKKNEIIY